MRRLLQEHGINRNLTALWLAQVISQSGDSIFQIGLMWLSLELSNSGSITGLVAMSSYLPSLAFGLFAGMLADRMDRRRIMLMSDLIRAILVLTIPILAYAGWITAMWLAITAFAVSSSAVFFYPARDALVPSIVASKHLLSANTLIQTSWQFALFIGPAIAALILAQLGKVPLFFATSITFALSFAFVWMIRISSENSTRERQSTGWKDVVEGIRYTFSHRILLPLMLLTIADNLLIMGPATVGTPVFVKQALGLGATAYATTEAAYAVGMIIGTVVLWMIGQRFFKGKILLIGMFLDGITFVPVYFTDSLLMLQLAFVIHSIAIPALIVPRAAIMQEIVPEHMRGRIFALLNIAVVGMASLSSALTGFAIDLFGVREVFLAIGIGGGLCGIAGWMFAHQLRECQ